MAIPGLFKSFRHDISKQLYSAASPRLSNPIMIADAERKILWFEGQSANYTDLIVSIGTGLEAEPNAYTGGSIKSGAQSFIGSLRKLSFQRDSTKNMSNARSCQAASDEFVRTLSTSSHPPRYIRLNPISVIGLPAIDDIEKMQSIRSMAGTHIDHYEIKTIATRLLAAMFYFETDRDIVEQVDGRFIAQGELPMNTIS